MGTVTTKSHAIRMRRAVIILPKPPALPEDSPTSTIPEVCQTCEARCVRFPLTPEERERIPLLDDSERLGFLPLPRGEGETRAALAAFWHALYSIRQAPQPLARGGQCYRCFVFNPTLVARFAIFRLVMTFVTVPVLRYFARTALRI